MTKSEIIESILSELRNSTATEECKHLRSNVSEIEAIAELEERLEGEGPDTTIRTCRDFSYLNVTCCEVCHLLDPAYELSLVDLQGGGNAWLCCAMTEVLNPKEPKCTNQSTGYKPFADFFAGNHKVADVESDYE
jgi:hypothetical protein